MNNQIICPKCGKFENIVIKNDLYYCKCDNVCYKINKDNNTETDSCSINPFKIENTDIYNNISDTFYKELIDYRDFQVEEQSNLEKPIKENKELINFNQNVNMEVFGFPKERVLIDRSILDTEPYLNSTDFFFNFDKSFNETLSKGDSISLENFNKLKNLLGKEIPHKNIIGKKIRFVLTL